jgi:hypothetical protein
MLRKIHPHGYSASAPLVWNVACVDSVPVGNAMSTEPSIPTISVNQSSRPSISTPLRTALITCS